MHLQCLNFEVKYMKFMLTIMKEWISEQTFKLYMQIKQLQQESLKKKKNSRMNEIQTHDLCNTGAVLYQLSY